MNEPASPRAIVIQMLIGSGPGSASRASAPMISPQRTRKISSESIGAVLRAQPVEQTHTGRLVLGVVEDAPVVQLLEEAEEMCRILGRVLGHGTVRRLLRLLLRRRLGDRRDERRADRVGVDAGTLEALPVLGDAEAPLGETVR